MQPYPDPVLMISPEARDAICRTRPELARHFLSIGGRACIPVAALLARAQNPPHEQFRGRMDAPCPTPGLGDRLAAFLRRLGIAALMARFPSLAGCGCAARARWLNRQGERLKSILDRYRRIL